MSVIGKALSSPPEDIARDAPSWAHFRKIHNLQNDGTDGLNQNGILGEVAVCHIP